MKKLDIQGAVEIFDHLFLDARRHIGYPRTTELFKKRFSFLIIKAYLSLLIDKRLNLSVLYRRPATLIDMNPGFAFLLRLQ